ncbi:phage holin family protein [Canibacter sp. lx-45]|uniref:phage holin family protein n=1 Tax=Canibacter zhuwentaonis TaxID=2837491 RepID=UPI001BDD4925|nr:phage holin family protein [Canibacter zhuwentaonis]
MVKKSPSTLKLLARLPGQIGRIIETEAKNAKAEVSGRMRNLVIGLVLFIISLVVLFWSTAVLLASAVAGISEALPVWLAALIIGGTGFLTVVVLVIVGILLLKKGNPVPHQTIARVKQDLRAAKNVKASAEQVFTQPGKAGTKPGNKGVWE